MKPEPVKWALIVDGYNRIRHVRLETVEHELAKYAGAYVIAREDVELCVPLGHRERYGSSGA